MNIIIINRWEDKFADYEKMIDHSENTVIYLTNNSGEKYLKNITSDHIHYLLSDLNDVDALVEILTMIKRKLGQIDRIIALSEYDIKTAGILRSQFNIRGMNEKVSRNFTNKFEMKHALQNTDLLFPKNTKDVKDIRSKLLEFPLVIKPCEGAASENVCIVKDQSSFEDIYSRLEDPSLYEFEEYVAGPIYHVDGLKNKNVMQFMCISRYINTCYEYEVSRKPLGSVLINDRDLYKRVEKMVLAALNALGMSIGVFHLEFILKNNDLVFLEVGARQGGGEIVPLIKKVFSIDLVECLLRCQMLECVDDVKEKRNFSSGGFLLFPEPLKEPVKVKKVVNFSYLETLNYAIVPKVGQILDGNGGYYFNAGRFMFSGDKASVKQEMQVVLENYEVEYE